MATDKTELLARSMVKVRQGTEYHKYRSCSGSSRFAQLEDIAEDEGIEMEGINEDKSGNGGEDMGAHYEPGSSVVINKEKKLTDCDNRTNKEVFWWSVIRIL